MQRLFVAESTRNQESRMSQAFDPQREAAHYAKYHARGSAESAAELSSLELMRVAVERGRTALAAPVHGAAPGAPGRWPWPCLHLWLPALCGRRAAVRFLSGKAQRQHSQSNGNCRKLGVPEPATC